MRQALLGVVGMLAAGSTQAAETYTFTAVVQKLYSFPTTIYCVEPVKFQGRVPQRGCTLSERAIAFPNSQHIRALHQGGVACAAGFGIAFYPNGTLAWCRLESEQQFDKDRSPWLTTCVEWVIFGENGFADCDY